MTRAGTYFSATVPALAVLGFFVWFANWIPQTRWEPPKTRLITSAMSPAELAKAGAAIVRERGCMACHTIEPGAGVKGQGRGPNLDNVAVRRAKGVPGGAATLVEYLAQSLYEPGAHLVEGYANIMPASNRPPANLTHEEITAVVAYLQSLGGASTVKLGDLARPAAAQPRTDAARSESPATKDPKALLAAFNCLDCHSMKVGEVLLGPPFEAAVLKAAAKERGLSLEAYLIESIVNPRVFVRAPFLKEAKEVMPDDYGQRITSAQLWIIVEYLRNLEERK